MKILINIGHPAHVHHFKNMIWNLENHGYEVKIVSMDKDVALYLLDAYGFKYEKAGKNYKGLTGKTYSLIETDYLLYKIAKRFEPDIFVSRGSPSSAHVSKLMHKPHIAFCDTEHARLNDFLAYPFTDVILTPSCFKKDLGIKQVRYNGYHELAYLHPKYFKPDPSVLEDLELGKKDKLIILRLVSWNASHDFGQKGITAEMKSNYLKKLLQYGRVLISSEAPIEKKFEQYKLKISPEKMHSLLNYSHLCIGDSCTVSEEAAILGTPSIHISTLAKFCGVFDDMQNNYDIVHTYDDDKQALEKALELLEDKNIKQKWQKKREKLLNEKIDVTKFMTDFIEKYPKNYLDYKNEYKKQ